MHYNGLPVDSPVLEARPMLRLRRKADGRIVEVLADGSERALPASERGGTEPLDSPAAYARDVRARTRLTQAEFATRIGVPIETVRNWEQGKRSPRGPARALLKLIEKAPDVAFQVLSPR
jgi:putative transcriptional regulator